MIKRSLYYQSNFKEAKPLVEQKKKKNDFKYKLAIDQKEINETIYWLDLLIETEYLTKEQFESINEDAIEILKLLTSII